MIRRQVKLWTATATIIAASVWVVFLATHLTVDTYNGAGGQRGVVVGWRGRAPGIIQCAGFEYGTHPGPFVNIDC